MKMDAIGDAMLVSVLSTNNLVAFNQLLSFYNLVLVFRPFPLFVAYIRLSGFFAAACFVLSIIATILTSFGLSSRDPNRKYTFYRFALYIDLAARKCTIPCIIYQI